MIGKLRAGMVNSWRAETETMSIRLLLFQLVIRHAYKLLQVSAVNNLSI